MTSSTLPSRRDFPKLALLLLSVGCACWALAAFYTFKVNPDVRDFTAGAKIKAAWNQQLRSTFSSNYIVFGGSSSSFSVDPQYALTQHHFPLANLALGAGLGARVLIRFAAFHARPGDTLIMSMEPGLLAGSLAVPQLGQQVSIALGHPEFAAEHDAIPGTPIPLSTYISALRPGGAHFFTLIGKLAMGRPLYRYEIGVFLPSGQKTTEIRDTLSTPRGLVTLGTSAHDLLSAFKHWGEKHRVNIVYTLPWAYCPPNQLEEFKRENLHFLEQMVQFFPVLHEPRLGAYEVDAHFADTAWHLNQEGARIRTRELIEALNRPLLQDRPSIRVLLTKTNDPTSAE